MIVQWSETYLRTSLTNAFNAVRSSPPNVSSYLVEPTPPIERNVHATPSSTTRLSSIINKTDHEREAAAAAAATTASSNPTWQANLPDVCAYFILNKYYIDFVVYFVFRIGFQLLFEM
jgi:hypothetical protein